MVMYVEWVTLIKNIFKLSFIDADVMALTPIKDLISVANLLHFTIILVAVDDGRLCHCMIPQERAFKFFTKT